MKLAVPLNESDKQCAYNRSSLLCGACKEGYSLAGTRHFSMQAVYQQPSCLAYSFCSDGSSIGLLTPCLQTDSGNRNAQWASIFLPILLELIVPSFYQWNLLMFSQHLLHGYTLTLVLKHVYDGMDARRKNMVVVCVSCIYLGTSRTHKQLLTQICEHAW